PIPVAAATTEVNIPLADIVAGKHAVNVERPEPDDPEDSVACANIGGVVDEQGDLFVGLGESNGSGLGTLDIDRVLTGDDIGQRNVHFRGGSGNWNRRVAEVLGDDFGAVTFRKPRYPFREQEIRKAFHGLGTEIGAIAAMEMRRVSDSDIVIHRGRRGILSEAGCSEPDGHGDR
ncbi:MAG: hypothetical protein K0S99_3167, partial [Thermomicrobiales bacterium]|nr:hypothetical protein [Thermomicrobiales bacterium]